MNTDVLSSFTQNTHKQTNKQTNTQTNKQTYKQTNKQTHICLDKQYISQIKSGPHKAPRKTSCGYPKMIPTNNEHNKQNKQTNKQTNKLTN